jgi:uncharacterized membrane protein
MKRAIIACTMAVAMLALQPAMAGAQEPARGQDYARGTVMTVEPGDDGGGPAATQSVRVRLRDGQEIVVEHPESGVPVGAGDDIVLTRITRPDGSSAYFIADHYRLNATWVIVAGFALLVVVAAGVRGVGALAGLAISLLVIVGFIVPRIVDGANPLMVSLGGGSVILVVTTYIAHGVSARTTIAIAGALSALVATFLLALVSVALLDLSGTGSQDAAALQFGETAELDLRGLLLAAIIIGTLGALDDITATQAAVVFEIASERGQSATEIFRRAMVIGREHIISLVNTLVLAYAGAALVVFIYLEVNRDRTPVWVTLNSELVTEEVVRTVAGSAGLMLAVPLTTLVATWWVKRRGARSAPTGGHAAAPPAESEA